MSKTPTAEITKTDTGYDFTFEAQVWHIETDGAEWVGYAADSLEMTNYCDTRYDVLVDLAGWDIADAIGRKQNAKV